MANPRDGGMHGFMADAQQWAKDQRREPDYDHRSEQARARIYAAEVARQMRAREEDAARRRAQVWLAVVGILLTAGCVWRFIYG